MVEQRNLNPSQPIGTASGGVVYPTRALLQFLQRAPLATTVARLPDAARGGAGVRNFVTDAVAPSFGAVVISGGSTATPVYSDGAVWRVG